jgi:hypothetical protein
MAVFIAGRGGVPTSTEEMSSLVWRGQTSSLCVYIARAVEQSNNSGEVLHFWMEFVKFDDVCACVCKVTKDVLYCPRYPIHPCNIIGSN